jgi:alpha-tubulin suppressor-like RCC1 family protein/protocatechuate 3,4-dioxygenase beta subunit
MTYRLPTRLACCASLFIAACGSSGSGGGAGVNNRISAAQSTVSCLPATAIADGVASISVAVTVKDSAGTPVPGALVVFGATGTSHTFSPESAVTGANGVAMSTLVSVRAEVKTVSAVADGVALGQTQQVQFTSGTPDVRGSTLEATPPTALQGTPIALHAKIGDRFGNPVSGVAVTFASNYLATFVQPTALTGADGLAVGVVTSYNLGAHTLVANVGGVALASTTVGFTATPGAAIVFMAQPGSATAGAALTDLTVASRDASGVPTPFATAVTVTLLDGSGATLYGTTVAPAGASTATFSGLSIQKAGTYRLRVTSGALVVDSVAFVVAPASPSAAASSVVAQPSSVPNDGTPCQITATARDKYGNGIAGATVYFGGDASATFNAASASTDPAGVASVYVYDLTRGTYTISASVGAVTIGSTSVQFTPQPVAQNSKLTFSTAIAPADGNTPIAVHVQLLDSVHAPVAGRAIAVSHAGGATVMPVLTVTDSNGLATFQVTSSAPTSGVLNLVVDPGATGTLLLSSTSVAFDIPVAWKSVARGRGAYHSAAIRKDGTLWTWGANDWGELGDGTTIAHSSPVQVGTDSWLAVSVGEGFTTAIKSDGTLWAWGVNSVGQLGDGTTTERHAPTQIGTDNRWIAVSGGGTGGLAIRSDGTLWAWGWNTNGEVCDGTAIQRLAPVFVASGVLAAEAGGGFVLVVKSDHTLWGCGADGYGQLGIQPASTTTAYHNLIRIGSDNRWLSVAAGDSHGLGIKSDGTLWGWGANTYGQAGNYYSNVYPPLQIGGATNWTSITAGSYYSAALAADGTLWTWGYHHQLGVGPSAQEWPLYDQHQPVQVLAGTQWGFVAANYSTAFGIKSDDTLWAWGSDLFRQLGDGDSSTFDVAAPQLVP